MPGKDLKFIDLNLLSGSSETMRTAVNFCWSQISASTTGEQISWPADPNTESMVGISDISANTDLIDTLDSENIVPNYRIPLRYTGDENMIDSDEHWKAFLLGGTFGEHVEPGVFNTDTFDDHMFTYAIPYSEIESKELSEQQSSPGNQIAISYQYNSYLKDYENHIAELETPLDIPNIYLLDMLASGPALDVDEDISSFVKLAGDNELTDDQVEALFTAESTKLLPITDFYDAATSTSTVYDDKTINLYKYLTDSYVNAGASIKERLQNIFFDDSAAQDWLKQLWSNGTAAAIFPFYIELDIPRASDTTDIRGAITDNTFSSQFLKMIKETFSGEVSSLVPASLDFSVEASYEIVTTEDDETTVSDVNTVSTHSFRSINLMKSLAYYHNNYLSETDNCYFMGELTDSRKAALDSQGVHRYINTIGASNTMESLLSISSSFDVNSATEEALADLYGKADDSKHNETVAYRVEKRQGTTTLQNFWIFNSTGFNAEDIKLLDSQIKYGEEYTYRVYAYVVVIGHKYNFSDLAITKHFGPIELSGSGACLEFYNPTTDKSTAALYSGAEDEPDNPSNFLNPTDAQLISDDNYLADFYLNYEPTFKLIEVPIYSKTLQVLDHPSTALEAIPFQYMDDSQKIGFTLAVDTSRFTAATRELPEPISPDDKTLLASYMSSNNLISGEEISIDSVSRIRFVEVYRIDSMPTAFSDFAGNRLSIIDLRIENTESTISKTQFADKINTNKKYYYLFRGLNEHEVPTHLSEIYEAQLIDDGGYKYSLFDVVYEEDFETSIYINPLTSFKKLFHLKPSLSHLVLDTSELDYTQTALGNLTDDNLIVGVADETIWGKTFKLRLLSKKTGKRIDLNVTYNLENE